MNLNVLDNTGGLGRFRSLTDSPSANFVRSTSEVPNQLKKIKQKTIIRNRKTGMRMEKKK